jgi:hypothetical protein
MNPEKQRIAIAEACGHSPNAYTESMGVWTPAEIASIPDYLNDLNAMHEAEKTLTLKQRNRYADELFTMLPDYKESYAPVWCMTAAQRAEAFLRTLGKWE